MAILPSQRQGMYYLEHCRVMARDERVVYAKEEGAFTKFFSIPPANTNVILLGTGTSITQPAARVLSEAGVMLGFVGGGGTPLFLASQSEYRPTSYFQDWISFWVKPEKVLEAAKLLQHARVRFLLATHSKLEGFKPSYEQIAAAAEQYLSSLLIAETTQQVLGHEATFAKALYKAWAQTVSLGTFVRKPGMKDFTDLFNSFLDHGNYLAYGLAATVLWVLGIPHSLPVLHGNTRKGALVFDLADVIKDAVVMPVAFKYAAAKQSDQEMRAGCLALIDTSDAIQALFETTKSVIERLR